MAFELGGVSGPTPIHLSLKDGYLCLQGFNQPQNEYQLAKYAVEKRTEIESWNDTFLVESRQRTGFASIENIQP